MDESSGEMGYDVQERGLQTSIKSSVLCVGRKQEITILLIPAKKTYALIPKAQIAQRMEVCGCSV